MVIKITKKKNYENEVTIRYKGKIYRDLAIDELEFYGVNESIAPQFIDEFGQQIYLAFWDMKTKKLVNSKYVGEMKIFGKFTVEGLTLQEDPDLLDYLKRQIKIHIKKQDGDQRTNEEIIDDPAVDEIIPYVNNVTSYNGKVMRICGSYTITSIIDIATVIDYKKLLELLKAYEKEKKQFDRNYRMKIMINGVFERLPEKILYDQRFSRTVLKIDNAELKLPVVENISPRIIWIKDYTRKKYYTKDESIKLRLPKAKKKDWVKSQTNPKDFEISLDEF